MKLIALVVIMLFTTNTYGQDFGTEIPAVKRINQLKRKHPELYFEESTLSYVFSDRMTQIIGIVISDKEREMRFYFVFQRPVNLKGYTFKYGKTPPADLKAISRPMKRKRIKSIQVKYLK